jgi:hypothetical protein
LALISVLTSRFSQRCRRFLQLPPKNNRKRPHKLFDLPVKESSITASGQHRQDQSFYSFIPQSQAPFLNQPTLPRPPSSLA